MRYLFVFAVITLVLTAGCQKSEQPPTHEQILASHTWYLKDLAISDLSQNTDCNLSDQLTFNKDSTGYHYYSILCDSTQPSKMSFHWYIEDNMVVNYPGLPNYYTGAIQSTILYTTRIAGKADSSTTLRLFRITQDSLIITGVVNGGQNYYAVYTSAQ